MNNVSENPESSSGRFIQSVQPLRDLQSNWTVDLAKNLEEYLLKICSGEITGADDAIISVNFAEAALLLQGSVQVYSRKLMFKGGYIYSLMMHIDLVILFDYSSSQEDQAASTSSQPESTGTRKTKDEEDDSFWGLDDIAVEPKNLLDSATCRDVPPSHFLRPPANLVVLEGECLDAACDAGELESYLLATNDVYRDFILLDSCDAVEVDNFLNCKAGKGPTNGYRGSSVTSKGHKSFQSPSRRSGGTAHKSVGKKQDASLTHSPCVDHGFESNDCNMGPSPPADDFPDGNSHGFGDLVDSDDDDDDDPWKPLNPHEPGNLKVKPYKKLKPNRRLGNDSKKHLSVTTEFPLAKLHGPISKELTNIWEAKFGATERHCDSQPLPLYEKLRQSLVVRERKTNDEFCNHEDNPEDNGFDSWDQDVGAQDFDMPDNTFNNEDVPPYQEMHDDGVNYCEDPDAHASLEDLCRSHLDALLANLAETEKQTELAARVSTWKQRIEQNLEEQDARPPFDIHKYGDKVLDKLSVEGDGANPLDFGDVVRGQEKHDVARTFSALLQLVNNGDVDLVRSNKTSTPTCHSNVNPFYVRLLKNERKKGVLLQSSKKRQKSPLVKRNANVKSNKEKDTISAVYPSPTKSTSSCRFTVNLGKASATRCTPEGKKRRKSRVLAPMDVQFAG
ncbi:hypothetical protein RD792_017108 [Penstemon davidsonii]|uniref:Condensin-2 complex subunit H2 n=1 Tax=Penstemon davidsonii TaxID=160366 RepID=A0ABR0CLN8_9LAMI|nr:hypothetical protein RD792_017108 [Penstemon davidsonii]